MPTAKMAAVTNHNTREDGINADLNNDESWRRFIMDALHEPECAAIRRNVENSARGSRSLVKLTIISGLNRAWEFMDNLAARQQMVDQQIRTWEVLDPRVLEVFSRVPREAFVPPEYRDLAFADAPIPIGFGQFMLAPKIQGRILQALGVLPIETVLEIGTGTGYLAACLSLLGAAVRSIDIHPEFTLAAKRAVANAQVEFQTRDAFDGAPFGEYDAIAVTGSLPLYDDRFQRSLRIGGRLFAIVGEPPVMDAILVRRVDDSEWIRESLFETVIDPLIHAPAAQSFIF